MDRHIEEGGVHQSSLPTIALVTYIIKTIKAAANVRIAEQLARPLFFDRNAYFCSNNHTLKHFLVLVTVYCNHEYA